MNQLLNFNNGSTCKKCYIRNAPIVPVKHCKPLCLNLNVKAVPGKPGSWNRAWLQSVYCQPKYFLFCVNSSHGRRGGVSAFPRAPSPLFFSLGNNGRVSFMALGKSIICQWCHSQSYRLLARGERTTLAPQRRGRISLKLNHCSPKEKKERRRWRQAFMPPDKWPQRLDMDWGAE